MCVGCGAVVWRGGGNLSVMRLRDPDFAVFTVQVVLGKGQQVGVAVDIQVGGVDGLVHHSGVAVVVHQRSRVVVVHQRS